MSTPGHSDANVDDLHPSAPPPANEPAPAAQPPQDAPVVAPEGNSAEPKNAATEAGPSLATRPQTSPPTPPDLAKAERRPSKPSVRTPTPAMLLRPRARLATRLPQGLGGPNIPPPSAPRRPDAKPEEPAGIGAVQAVASRERARPEFEGDKAIKTLRQRLSLDPEFLPAPP